MGWFSTLSGGSFGLWIGGPTDVLGVSPDDSDATIKKTSHSRVKDFHPDRLESKGLPEEMMRLAENRMKEFSLAYERITRARNF